MLRSGRWTAIPLLLEFTRDAAALPSRRSGVVECYCKLQLDPAEQQQNDHDDEQQTHPTAREVAPGTAVVPRRESAHQKQNQKNNQNGSKHTFLLVSKNPASADCGFREHYDAPYWSRSSLQSWLTDAGDVVFWGRTGRRLGSQERLPLDSRRSSRQSRPKGESCARARSTRLLTCAAC